MLPEFTVKPDGSVSVRIGKERADVPYFQLVALFEAAERAHEESVIRGSFQLTRAGTNH